MGNLATHTQREANVKDHKAKMAMYKLRRNVWNSLSPHSSQKESALPADTLMWDFMSTEP